MNFNKLKAYLELFRSAKICCWEQDYPARQIQTDLGPRCVTIDSKEVARVWEEEEGLWIVRIGEMGFAGAKHHRIRCETVKQAMDSANILLAQAGYLVAEPDTEFSLKANNQS